MSNASHSAGVLSKIEPGKVKMESIEDNNGVITKSLLEGTILKDGVIEGTFIISTDPNKSDSRQCPRHLCTPLTERESQCMCDHRMQIHEHYAYEPKLHCYTNKIQSLCASTEDTVLVMRTMNERSKIEVAMY